MSDIFSVGEVVILIESFCFPEYNGSEVEVTGGLKPRTYFKDRAGTVRGGPDPRYQVTASDGACFSIPPERLKKKLPPREETCKWEECLWRPSTKETA